MAGEVVGRVTEEEKNEILIIFERKLGIEELTTTIESDWLSLNAKEVLQDKMIAELDKTKLNMQIWWDKMYEKYQWKIVNGHEWHIDFSTREIFLI